MSTDLDLTFNSPIGFTTTGFNFSIQDNYCRAIALQTDGKIIMAGDTNNPSISPVIALARYNTNGLLDPAFGTGGLVTSSIPLYSVNTYSLTIQQDGSIVVCGSAFSPQPEIFVARFTSNGTLDTSNFNSPNGYVIIQPSIFNSTYPTLTFTQTYATSVQIDTTVTPNKIVIGGYVGRSISGSTRFYFAVERLNLNGNLDITFNTTGVVAYNFNSLTDEFCYSLEITNSGDYILGGSQGQKFSIVKLDNSGLPVSAFGTFGIAVIPNFFIGSYENGSSLKIQQDGKYILGGTTTKIVGDNCFAIVRVDPILGTLDSSFGIGGKVITDLSPAINLLGKSVAIQSDGKIILAGSYNFPFSSVSSFSLARYNSDGSLDTTFGLAGNGLILEDLVPGTMQEQGESLAIQLDGKILLGGTMGEFSDISNDKYFILARYLGFPPFPPPVPPVPIIPICFPAGTPVLTDQGNIDIEKINPEIHTIHNKAIVAVTQSFLNDENIVCIEKHSLGINIPNKKTYISNNHGIVYKNKLIQAKQLVGRLLGINFVKYNNELVYNVLMEKHYIMIVNNIRVETLNPKNMIAKLYTNEYTSEDKYKLILEINEISNNNINNRKKFYNNYEKITNNVTRRKFSILRCNPLIKNLNFHTKKHFVRHSNLHNQTSKQANNMRNNNYKFKHSFRRIR